jgi:hypothetical protein
MCAIMVLIMPSMLSMLLVSCMLLVLVRGGASRLCC